jgi:hypothetical protein
MATRRRRTERGRQGLEPIGAVIVRASPDQPQRGPASLPLWLWQEAVGPRIARRARPVRLERGVLTVRAATSVWAQELTFLAPTIIAQLATLGLAVSSIRFSVGTVETLPHVPKPAAMPATAEGGRPLGRELTGAIAKIDDAGLRGVIARAAKENLAWQARGKAAPAGSVTSAKPAFRDPRSAGPKTSAPARTSPATPAKSRDRS